MSLHLYIHIIDQTALFAACWQFQSNARVWFCPEIFWAQVILYVPYLKKCVTEEILSISFGIFLFFNKGQDIKLLFSTASGLFFILLIFILQRLSFSDY